MDLDKQAICCQLPIEFVNGLRIVEVTAACWHCGASIPSVSIDGQINYWGKHIVAVTGRGTCSKCGELSPIDMRVSDDQVVRMHFQNRWICSLDPNYSKIFQFKEKARRLTRTLWGGDKP